MFKIVASAVGFVALIALVIVVVKKVPQINEVRGCYEETNAIYSEKYIVTRRAYTKDSQICSKNKTQILKGAQCFYRLESELEVMDGELPILKKIVTTLSSSSKELDEVVMDHNERCEDEENQVHDYELKALQAKYAI